MASTKMIEDATPITHLDDLGVRHPEARDDHIALVTVTGLPDAVKHTLNSSTAPLSSVHDLLRGGRRPEAGLCLSFSSGLQVAQPRDDGLAKSHRGFASMDELEPLAILKPFEQGGT